jgi:hypothetical protein
MLINKTEPPKIADHPQIWGYPVAGFQSSVPYTGIFFSGILEQVTDPIDDLPGDWLYPEFLRGFFEVSSGSVREFPKPSRTLPEHFPKKTGYKRWKCR